MIRISRHLWHGFFFFWGYVYHQDLASWRVGGLELNSFFAIDAECREGCTGFLFGAISDDFFVSLYLKLVDIIDRLKFVRGHRQYLFV